MSTNIRAILFSLFVHVMVLGVLVFSFEQKPMPLNSAAKHPEAVEAVAVDEARVQAELRRLRSAEQSQRTAEEERRQRLEEEAEEARKTKEEEARRLAELKAQREQEQREAEQQRKQLAELKLEQERIQKERTELEKKRVQEQQRLAEAEKQRKSEEARAARLENERQLREKLAAEEQENSAARKQQLSRLVQQYELDIRNKVRRNWLRPAGTGDFSCKVFVRQLPGGDVVSVQVTQSCGNAALDRSVEAAVRKASPLPAPPDPDLFDKEINFTFKPR